MDKRLAALFNAITELTYHDAGKLEETPIRITIDEEFTIQTDFLEVLKCLQCHAHKRSSMPKSIELTELELPAMKNYILLERIKSLESQVKYLQDKTESQLLLLNTIGLMCKRAPSP